MSVCALCGQPTLGEDICFFHIVREPGNWAAANRTMCNFVHRGIVPPASLEPEADFEPPLDLLDEALTP